MENVNKSKRTNDFAGHRRRLREKFIKGGISALSDYELLELLLSYSIPRKDVKPLAKNLLKRFRTVGGVFSARASELLTIDGLGEMSVALIKLVHACQVKFFEEKLLNSNPLSCPEDVVKFSTVLLSGCQAEYMMVIFVNSRNKVIGYEFISEGTVDQAIVYPRKIIEYALEKKANGLFLVHNHPGGEPEPSREDINLTRAIKDLAKGMDIRVLDHIIVAGDGGGYYSFLENALL